MTEHRAMCPWQIGEACQCALIARVRADERERAEYASDCWDGCTQKEAIEAEALAHAEAVAARLVEVICDDAAMWERATARADGFRRDAAAFKAERDAARAEAQRFSAEINRMVSELSSIRMEHEAEVAALRAKWEADIDILNGLNKRLDDVAELLHRQRVLHANLIAPTHPNAPVLIQVDQVLALIEETDRG